jgi:hypothetical protein
MSKNEQKAIIFLIIVGLLIFALGAASGFFYASRNPKIQQAQTVIPTINLLGSKVVQSVSAFGTVTKIEGSNVTLSYEGDEITIPISNSAQIFSALVQRDSTGSATTGIPQQVSVRNIKVGQNLVVNFSVNTSGQITGNQVTIFAGTGQ